MTSHLLAPDCQYRNDVLMDILGALNVNSEDFTEKASGRSIKFLVFALISLLPLGYTLAANINLGSGSPIEFGQGVVVATSCDDHILVTPRSVFANWENDFQMRELTVSDVANKCIGKSFEIGFFGETSSVLSNPYGPLVIYFSGSVSGNLHFELDSKNITLATFKTASIDTSSVGIGPEGASKRIGASSFTLGYVVKDDFMPFFTHQVSRITLQSHGALGYVPSAMADPYISSCLAIASTNNGALESLVIDSNKKTQGTADLVDLSLAVTDEYLAFSSAEKSKRASEYLNFAETGLRLTAFLGPKLTQCVNRFQGFIQNESDNYRWALQSAIRDAGLAAMDMNDDAGAAFQALKTAAIANL